MKRRWKFLMLASFLFVSLGITPVYAESPASNVPDDTLLVNAVKGRAIQVKDKHVFQENFIKTSRQYTSNTSSSPMRFDAPHAFYCSGFVQEIYRKNGVWIPAHSIAEQTLFGLRVDNLNKLEPGDLVFFSNVSGQKVPAHVGIALGNGRLLHASGPDHLVSLIELNDQLRNHFLFATRLVTSV